MRNLLLHAWVVAAFLLVGCVDKNRALLDAGDRALEQKNFDQVLSNANAYLAAQPKCAGAAHAMYLRGRAYEQRVAGNLQESRANLNVARRCYIEAMQRSPSRPLEAYIRTSLAQVAYDQDDYRSAIVEWTTAYEMLDRTDLRSWVLYRIGLCQQRLGRFADADRTFVKVQMDYPRTAAAARAKLHQGHRQFYLQLATYSTPAAFDKAMNDLRLQGINPLRVIDSTGRQIVRIGPFATYDQARSAHARFAGHYPDAVILP